jgi:hypothetical protein
MYFSICISIFSLKYKAFSSKIKITQVANGTSGGEPLEIKIGKSPFALLAQCNWRSATEGLFFCFKATFFLNLASPLKISNPKKK